MVMGGRLREALDAVLDLLAHSGRRGILGRSLASCTELLFANGLIQIPEPRQIRMAAPLWYPSFPSSAWLGLYEYDELLRKYAGPIKNYTSIIAMKEES